MKEWLVVSHLPLYFIFWCIAERLCLWTFKHSNIQFGFPMLNRHQLNVGCSDGPHDPIRNLIVPSSERLGPFEPGPNSVRSIYNHLILQKAARSDITSSPWWRQSSPYRPKKEKKEKKQTNKPSWFCWWFVFQKAFSENNIKWEANPVLTMWDLEKEKDDDILTSTQVFFHLFPFPF